MTVPTRKMTDTAAAVGPAACGWDETDGLAQPWACEELAICTVTEQCEHEHVGEARACAHHAVEVQMARPGPCYRCGTRSGEHDCPTTSDQLGRLHSPAVGPAEPRWLKTHGSARAGAPGYHRRTTS